MKTLYIIDGYAQFFRAYHAIRTRMTSPVTKEPTNATYGFVGMLLKLLREYKPDYLAVAIDVSGDRETFRSTIYPEYKANREPPPEDFGPQAQRCIEILRKLGIPVLGEEGFEADDVIASVVERLSHEHAEPLRIRIVSKDKDLQQLIRDMGDENLSVELFDVHNDEVIDEKKLGETRSVTPDQVIDMLALMGDTVDNIPGVKGIGPKTAAQLIADYGSLEGVIEEARKDKGGIKGKRRENILAAADALPLSRELVTLRRDVPVELDLAASQTGAIPLRKLAPILRELGFNRYQNELKDLLEERGEKMPEVGNEPAPAASRAGSGLFDGYDEQQPTRRHAGDYTCITSKKDLDDLIKDIRKADIVAFDTETTSLSPREGRLCGMSISLESGTGAYIPVLSPSPDQHLSTDEVLDAMRPVLEDPSIPKIGHNLKYDLLVLRQHGVRLRGIAHDTMISAYIIDTARSSYSLDNLALALLGHTCIPISQLIGTGRSQKTFDKVPLEEAAEYAAEDADISLRLYEHLAPQLKTMKLSRLFEDVELPLLDVLAEMEWNGIIVDPDELDRQRERLSERIDQLRREILDAAPRDFNPDSPKQLSSILFNKPDAAEPGLGIKPLKKTKTGYSTDVEVLERLAADPEVESELPALIVEHRRLTKLVGTYLIALKEAINPDTHRVHASFHQTVAATGRLSSSDPNLQNIPIRTEIGREIRKAFKAEEGFVLIGADYSQIELRLLAHLSEDSGLIEAFRNDEDIHRAVAAQVNDVPLDEVTPEQRSRAKAVNFGIVYGITPYGLARQLGISNTEAGEIIDDYKNRHPGITKFLERCVDHAQRKGYVQTMLGRRRPITELDSRNPSRRSLAERVAINSVVQGSAADLIKLAMIDLHRAFRPIDPDKVREDVPEDLRPRLADLRMLLQIHDELVFEAPQGVADAARDYIVSRMEGAMSLKVPIRVDASVSADWYAGK